MNTSTAASPTVSSNLSDTFFYGNRRWGYDRETIIELQPGVETLWPLFPSDGEFSFGLVQEGVDHKSFLTFKDKFERVGKLKIKDSFKKPGATGGSGSFDRFESIFEDYDKEQQIFGYKKFPVKLLCDR